MSRLSKELLIEQTYPNRKDIDDHFFAMLPMFKDKRYFRLHDKLVFVFYCIEDLVESDYFIYRWQKLANENGLPSFFFIGHTDNEKNLDSALYNKLDAINLHLLGKAFNESKINQLKALVFNIPQNAIPYSKAMYFWENNIFQKR